MTVSRAELRIATAEESAYARGGSFYQAVTAPVWRYLQKCGAQELTSDKSKYFLFGQPPLLVRIWSCVKRIFGCGMTVLTRFACTGFDRVDSNEKTVVKAILQRHRNGDVFLLSRGMQVFEGFLRECFPSITSNDFILTCQQNETKLFHKILRNVFQPKFVKNYIPALNQQCSSIFNSYREGEKANATSMAQVYFSSSFGENIFNNCTSGSKLNEHLNTFKQLIFRHTTKQSTLEDVNTHKHLVDNVREVTAKILHENPSLFMDDEEILLTEDTKRALIFLILFGAQDNTTTTLSAAIWHLATHPQEQTELQAACQAYQKNPNGEYPEALNKLFLEVLALYSPVAGVTRVAAQDLCLEYTLDASSKVHKDIIFKNELVIARTDQIGKSMLHFGFGPHVCPGMHYAQSAIKEFLAYTLANYQIVLSSPKELNFSLAFTKVLEQDVEVYFNKLQK